MITRLMGRRYADVMGDLLLAVVRGQFPEGGWLPSETELRATLGCGRGTLREALRGLQERGLIVVHAGRGQEVLQREYWDTRDPDVLRACIAGGPERTLLADTIDTRTIVEEAAARLAIEQATDADLAQLAALIAEMERALGPDAPRTFGAHDPLVVTEAWFHHTLALLSGNAQLAKVVEPLHAVIALERRQRAGDRDGAVVRHHRRILEGLSSREEDLAVDAVAMYARQLRRWTRGRF
jgi:GntR family transcriptional repressor for pyruvate dehydrogenase complex